VGLQPTEGARKSGGTGEGTIRYPATAFMRDE
jgi:hypothetical protein